MYDWDQDAGVVCGMASRKEAEGSSKPAPASNCIASDYDGDHYDVASSLLGLSSAPELMAQTILKKSEHIACL